MKLLPCVDKLANLRDIIRDYDRLGDGVWDIFNASKTSVAWYYISMLAAFGNGYEGIRDMAAFGNGYEGIRDMPAFQEFGKCVGGDVWGWVRGWCMELEDGRYVGK